MRNRILFGVSTVGINLLIAQIGASFGIAYPFLVVAIFAWTTLNAVYFGRLMTLLGLWKKLT
jgi:hypothetical protein